jgi:hypothetical protein
MTTEPTLKRFLLGEAREPLCLAEAEGKTIPCGNGHVPKIFSKPLIVSDRGEINGWKSGGRSALLHYEDRWYDLEGVRPSDKEWMLGFPEGGSTRTEAENELKASALFHQYGQNLGIDALTRPVCLFEYSKIQFRGERLYASVLETRGDLRLSHFLGSYLTVAAEAYEKLRNDSNKETKIDKITNDLKSRLTNKIGQWTGFWYRCLDESNLLWGTSYDEKPDKTTLNSNAGNNNLTFYRFKEGIGVAIVDLNGLRVAEEKTKSLEIDRIKKRLSTFEMTLHLLKHGKSAIDISQYQVLQTWASRLYKSISPPEGVNVYLEQYGYDPLEELALPQIDELDIIRSFNDGRKGMKPEFIEERCIASIRKMFLI